MENVRPSILLGILFGGACPATKSGISMPACDGDEGAPCPFNSLSSTRVPLAVHTGSTNQPPTRSFKHLSFSIFLSFPHHAPLSSLLDPPSNGPAPAPILVPRSPRFSSRGGVGRIKPGLQGVGERSFEKERDVGRDQRRRRRRGGIQIEDRRVFCGVVNTGLGQDGADDEGFPMGAIGGQLLRAPPGASARAAHWRPHGTGDVREHQRRNSK
jgi:hypothetical protein